MSVQVGIGISYLQDSFVAGVQAAREACQQIDKPTLVLAFGSIHHNHQELHKGICTQVDSKVLLGSSSYAEISPVGVSRGTIVVLGLYLPGARANFGQVHDYTTEENLGAELSRSLGNEALGSQDFYNLLLTLRGIGTGGEEFLNILQRIVGKAVIFGGLAGCDYDLGMSHPDFWKSYQYLDDGVSPLGARAANLALPVGDYKPAFGFAHGWTPVGPSVTITKAVGAEVFEVDGIPVFEFYRQFLGNTDSQKFFEGMIQRYAFSVEMEYSEQHCSVVRLPVICNFDKGSITYFPLQDLQGVEVRLLHGDRRGVLNGARVAAERCKEALGGMKPAVIFNISCCTRAVILHSRVNAEVEAIQKVFGEDIPVIGFYSGGEIFPYLNHYEDVISPDNPLGFSHYHATTVGVLALGTSLPVQIRLSKNMYGSKDIRQNVVEMEQLLRESEGILDDTQGFLTAISRKSYEISEILKSQNYELQQKNELNLRLQDIVHRYTPHEVWAEAGNSVKRGDYEIPEREVHRAYMFMDVKGFTAFSENHTPTTVIEHLNAIFHPSTESIYRHGGDVDKFIGDCIFAVFKDSSSAVSSAKEILTLFKEIKEKGNPFEVRIGINMGRAIHGNVGSADRREYTFIGDAVNLTQRLESSCTPGHILLSSPVFESYSGEFEKVTEREISVKGKRNPLRVFEVR